MHGFYSSLDKRFIDIILYIYIFPDNRQPQLSHITTSRPIQVNQQHFENLHYMGDINYRQGKGISFNFTDQHYSTYKDIWTYKLNTIQNWNSKMNKSIRYQSNDKQFYVQYVILQIVPSQEKFSVNTSTLRSVLCVFCHFVSWFNVLILNWWFQSLSIDLFTVFVL